MSGTNNIKRREFILELAKLAGAIGATFSAPGVIAATAKSPIDSVFANTLAGGRIVLSLAIGAGTSYKIFTLPNPDRLVIDLTDTKASGGIRLQGNAANQISGVRHAVRKTDDLRIVLDMKGAVKASPIMRGERLDITLTFAKGVTPQKQKQATNKQAQKRLQQQARRQQKPQRLQNTAKKPRQGQFVVAIDAGHGGKDPGAVGSKGTREKDVVLKISRQLKSIVDRAPGMRAVLVRNGDYYVSLRKRMEIARDHGADLFVSIHADANPDKRLKGSSVYILSEKGASSEAARFMAQKENAYDNKLAGASLNGKSDALAGMLLELSQEDTKEKSLDLAKNILKEIGRVNRLLRDRVESAAFAVLKSPDIPSMLVETAFISNPSDEKRLRTAFYQKKMANALFNGIKRYQIAQMEGATQYSDAAENPDLLS